VLHCGYFERGVCRSCTHLLVPYPEQVAAKQSFVSAALAA